MRINPTAEVVSQLGWREIVDLILEVVTHLSDGAAIGINGFWLQTLEFEVLEMGLVALIKISLGAGSYHVGVLHNWLQNHTTGIDGVNVQLKSCQLGAQCQGALLRVAAPSNTAVEQTDGYRDVRHIFVPGVILANESI